MKKLLIISCFLISTTAALASPKHDGTPEVEPVDRKEVPTTKVLKTEVPNFCFDDSVDNVKGGKEICEEASDEVEKDYMEELENKGMY